MIRAAQLVEKPLASQALVLGIQNRLKSQIQGKDDIIEMALATFLAGGHLLLEGPPGTGKTSLAKVMAGAFGGTFRRLQMTSDLLPSDIVGILRLKPGDSEFEFRRGPIFTNFLLADELNRTSPKTQSALLEAMAEGTVSVDGIPHILPNPFFVVATQNPLESHGVYPLAESQLDRFMLQLNVGSPDKADELNIYNGALTQLSSRSSGAPAQTEVPVISFEQTLNLRAEVGQVFVEASVLEYVTDLVRSTRFRADILHGVSVRGGLQLIHAARALAYLRGRAFVIPKDVINLAIPCLAHRLVFTQGTPEASQRNNVIHELLERVKAPK